MRVIWYSALAWATSSAVAQQPAQIPVVASFDSALKRDLDQSKFSVEGYRQTIRTTMRSFVPEGDSLKPQLLGGSAITMTPATGRSLQAATTARG